MLTIKDALVQAGKLDPKAAGRGRPSKEMVKMAEELVAQGWQIKGFALSKNPVSSTAETPKVVKEARRDPNAVVDIPDERRSESLWRAFAGGKEIGMRTVCINCSSSLTYCPCATSVVWVDFDTQGTVTFKPKKG